MGLPHTIRSGWKGFHAMLARASMLVSLAAQGVARAAAMGALLYGIENGMNPKTNPDDHGAQHSPEDFRGLGIHIVDV